MSDAERIVDTEALVARLDEWAHDEIQIHDDGRRLEAPDGTELVNGGAREDVRWIDRRTPFGNPFTTDDYERERAVRLYEGWFRGQIERGELDVEPLRGERLGCWCLPQLCHGVIVLNVLAETHDDDPQLTLGGVER